MTEILEKQGNEVSRAADGYDAVLQFESDKPDPLVAELTIPVMGGQNLCRILKESSSMPIVIISAQRTVEEVLKTLRGGADAIVPKALHRGKSYVEIEALLTLNSSPANG